MSEKTEKATPYKLKKAKEKGQVRKSNELNTSLSQLTVLCMAVILWPKILFELKSLMRHLLEISTNTQFSLAQITKLQNHLIIKLTNLWLPFALVSTLTLILTSTAQTGLVWSTTPITPDFKRLNGVQGFKKTFSFKSCFETCKNIVKLILAMLVIYCFLKKNLPHIMQLANTNPAQYPAITMHIFFSILFKLVLIMCVLAVGDLLYTRWNFRKDNRMSKQEIKDEYKQREGDSRIKAKMKHLQYQLRLKTASLKNIKTADVLITNPTHLAIALKYERNLMPAPKVVCKAQGELVEKVKQLAKKNAVPIIEHKAFAKALYQSIELNQFISTDLFPVAAAIFKEIYQQNKLSSKLEAEEEMFNSEVVYE